MKKNSFIFLLFTKNKVINSKKKIFLCNIKNNKLIKPLKLCASCSSIIIALFIFTISILLVYSMGPWVHGSMGPREKQICY